MRVLGFYLSGTSLGWSRPSLASDRFLQVGTSSPKASKSRTAPSPNLPMISLSSRIDTTPFSERSSAAAMTTQMGPKGFTSPNKVRCPITLLHSILTSFDTVSHHPPVSAYVYLSPENGIKICGELRPKSKFLGNSVSTIMEGEHRISFTRKPEDGGQCILSYLRIQSLSR